jgi:capsular exopolysaccharide synthesis family protein
VSRSTPAVRTRSYAGAISAREDGPDLRARLPVDVEATEPVEMGRYIDAFRRSRVLIACIVLPLTVGVYLFSASLPDRYRATAKLVLEGAADPLNANDVESTERRLATIQTLLTTQETLRGAAARVRGENAATLEDKVHASVTPGADIVSVSATADTPRKAAAIANAVASTYLARQHRSDRQQIARARASLMRDLNRLRGRRGVPAEEERASIRERLTELNLSAVSSGSELQRAEAARPPTEPYSPRPVRNAVFAFFASLFLAALVVVSRAQLKPRVSSGRELSRLLDAPILAEIPYVRRPFSRERNALSATEYEAYQTLQASLRMHLPPNRKRIVLVTSALHGEGKTEATAALGLVLSQAGHRIWLVSADMRWPKLHKLFDVARAPGLSELLVQGRQQRNGSPPKAPDDQSLTSETDPGTLHVLASGHSPTDPAQLLAGDAVETFFEEIRRSDYDYVLLDGPPLLGLVDSQVLAQRVDGVILVCRTSLLTPEAALDVRETLERLRVEPLGLVVIGGRRSPRAYLRA